jgi:hypothetical protein
MSELLVEIGITNLCRMKDMATSRKTRKIPSKAQEVRIEPGQTSYQMKRFDLTGSTPIPGLNPELSVSPQTISCTVFFPYVRSNICSGCLILLSIDPVGVLSIILSPTVHCRFTNPPLL